MKLKGPRSQQTSPQLSNLPEPTLPSIVSEISLTIHSPISLSCVSKTDIQYPADDDSRRSDIMPVVYSKLDASPLPFLHLLEVLKHLDRTGWKRWLDRPESVAAHMYRLEFLVMFAPVSPVIYSKLCLLT
jgi:hypothetical protein